MLAWVSLVCWAQRPEIGGIAGVPVTPSFTTGEEFHIGFGEAATSATRRYTVGPMLRVALPHGLGVELDVLYKRVGFDLLERFELFEYRYTRGIGSSWEFPILGSVRLPGRLPLRPYAIGGAALRAGNSVALSYYENVGGVVTPTRTLSYNPVLDGGADTVSRRAWEWRRVLGA